MLPLLKEANSNWLGYQSYIFELFWKGKISSSDYELSKSTGKLHQDGKPLKPDTMKKQSAYQKLKAENKKLRQQLYTLVMEPESLEGVELQLLLRMKYEMANAALQGGPQRNITILREPTEKDEMEIETLDLDAKDRAEILARFKEEWRANEATFKKDNPLEELIRRSVESPELYSYVRGKDIFGHLDDKMTKLERLNALTMLHNGMHVKDDLFLVHMSVARRLAEYRDEMAKKYSVEPPEKLYPSTTDQILEKAKNWSTDGYAMAVTDETADEGKGKGILQQIKESEPVPGNTCSRKDYDAWLAAIRTARTNGADPPELRNTFGPIFNLMTGREKREFMSMLFNTNIYLMTDELYDRFNDFMVRMVNKYSEQALKRQGKWGWIQETLQRIRDNWNKKA